MENVYRYFNDCFYPLALESAYRNSGTWPEKGVEVGEAIFAEFTQPAPPGCQRGTDENGYPAWVPLPALTKEELIEQAEQQRQEQIDAANNHINSKQWPGKAAIGRLKGDELTKYGLWLDYLDALEAVDTSGAPDINWPVAPQMS
ncbi:tail fiber assembly protein [Enterobacter sp.]|uniref:tail fiber assembly protein n=2 Tax=Enterobacter sp. TaxID=42895 RepID=UPI00296E8198|nr:tail fiber assembly protein [Enterobacter sp.]